MSGGRAYDVGFGKPPKRTQFQKGKSGNPKGRPVGALNLATTLEGALTERVIITEHGQRRPISKLEAMVKQAVNKAASGDAKAFQQVVHLMAQVLGPAQDPKEAGPSREQEQALVIQLLRRMKQQATTAVIEKAEADTEPEEIPDAS